MIQNDLSFLPLRVTRVGAGGKRSFDPADKQRLIDACLEPGASAAQPNASKADGNVAAALKKHGQKHGAKTLAEKENALYPSSK